MVNLENKGMTMNKGDIFVKIKWQKLPTEITGDGLYRLAISAPSHLFSKTHIMQLFAEHENALQIDFDDCYFPRPDLDCKVFY
jgi:hypothetical protein